MRQVGLVPDFDERFGETVSGQHVYVIDRVLDKLRLSPWFVVNLSGKSSRHFPAGDEPTMLGVVRGSGELSDYRFRQRRVMGEAYSETGEAHAEQALDELAADGAGASDADVKEDVQSFSPRTVFASPTEIEHCGTPASD